VPISSNCVIEESDVLFIVVQSLHRKILNIYHCRYTLSMHL